ncbi:serum response factor homolog isoform X2 [Phymastichus coffea]|uniref:serum response factor homolog isoform X2 n=1 Tax=Phymastichus coffea TaxID=108790 RepID=UPI00273AB852|nr:serum response factor homolog isoform X2 [Phymastichus coffea]
MDDSTDTRDTRYETLGYNINIMGSDNTVSEIYSRQSTSQLQSHPGVSNSIVTSDGTDTSGSLSTENINLISTNNTVISVQRGLKRTSNDMCYNDGPNETRQLISSSLISRDCVNDNCEESYNNIALSKKSPPSNGKKTKGRVKIKMEYIDNKLRRYTTFSKRKTGIMKKAYELSTLTGTQVMLLVASETGHVYTFATRKLQPMITSEAGKALIQTCLNSPDPPTSGSSGDQRMSATGFEETELSYNIGDDDQQKEPVGNFLQSADSSGLPANKRS